MKGIPLPMKKKTKNTGCDKLINQATPAPKKMIDQLVEEKKF